MNDSTPPLSPAEEKILPRILLVDDEPTLANLARLALSGRFDVLATTSPEEALALGEDPHVRLLLTDFQMEAMNGVELIRRLRAIRPDLPCILFSGNLTRDSWAAAHNAGCLHVIAKPLALRTVIELCTAQLSAPEPDLVPEQSYDFLDTSSWQGALGKNLRALAGHLRSGHTPVYLNTPGGHFPKELLLGLVPSLQTYAKPDLPPPPLPLFTDLDDLDLADQSRIAQLIPTRRDFPWFLAADALPDELLERGLLAESLYFRLGTSIVTLPSPSDCPADTLRLCQWWLNSQSPPLQLSDQTCAWLPSQFGVWDWTTLLSLFREASGQNGGGPIEVAHLQHASLAVSLGSDLGDIQRYPDFADHYTRQLRAAWELLYAPPAA